MLRKLTKERGYDIIRLAKAEILKNFPQMYTEAKKS